MSWSSKYARQVATRSYWMTFLPTIGIEDGVKVGFNIKKRD